MLETAEKILSAKKNYTDYINICVTFLISTEKNTSQVENTQSKKLCNLLLESIVNISKTTHDPDEVIFSFSSYALNSHEKSLLCKELNYAIALKSIKYSDYSFPLELFLWDVNRLNCSSFDKGCVKSRLRDCPHSSFQPVLKVSDKNLSVEEVKAFKNLKENKDLVIQKTNKDNTVVILNKNDYISRLN